MSKGLEIKKDIKVVEKDGKTYHYSNYYLVYNGLVVQVKPSFIDSHNFKLLDAIVELSKKGEK